MATTTAHECKSANLDRAEAAKLAEQRRWTARDRLRGFSRNKRQQACGMPGRLDGSGDVALRATPLPKKKQVNGKKYQGGYSGLFSCANIWTCPKCGVQIGAARANELAQVMGHFIEGGGTAALFTVTMRHSYEHGLDEAWDAIGGGWEHVTSGREWNGGWLGKRHEDGSYVRVPGTERMIEYERNGKTIRRRHPGDVEKEWVPGLMERYGCAGWDKNVDITIGPNGWHVHLHIVVMFDRRESRADIEEFGHQIFDRWAHHFEGSKFGVPLRDKGGFDCQHLDHDQAQGKVFDSVADMAAYVSKGLAMETNLAGFKTGKQNNRTMMELLLDATEPHELTCKDGTVVETVDMTARNLFLEYERVSKGRKMNSRSARVRELAAELAPETAELTEEELVEEDHLDGGDVAIIPRGQWYKIATRAVYLKQILEYDGITAARNWLTEAKVAWYKPHGLSEHFRSIERDDADPPAA